MDVIKDLSQITSLSKAFLLKLASITNKLIGHCVYENAKKFNNQTEVDIGIGFVNIFVVDNSIQYNFKPSDELESILVDVINNNKDELVDTVEESFRDRIINSYKDLL